MSKELDELERGIIEFEKVLEDDCNNEWLKRVVAGMKKCYQRLEAIDTANPSEALECLEKPIIRFARTSEDIDFKDYEEYDTIKQSLLKAQEQEKVLEIINEKEVNISSLKAYDLEEYNMIYENKLTQEEFDLLKRWMENDK